MKIISILLTIFLISSAISYDKYVTIVQPPKADASSCDKSQNSFYIWIQAQRSGFDVGTYFDLELSSPSGVKASCYVCADSEAADYCSFVTCTVDVKKNPIKQKDVILPKTIDGSKAGISFYDWEKWVEPNAKVASNVDCYSGYLKFGALLLVSLLLF